MVNPMGEVRKANTEPRPETKGIRLRNSPITAGPIAINFPNPNNTGPMPATMAAVTTMNLRASGVRDLKKSTALFRAALTF